MGVYNASIGTTSQKPYTISKGYPVDGRSYYYDEALFKWRAYQNVAEVLFYLNTPESRGGMFLIYINQGGTLSGSTFTGGTFSAYWFKDGVGDSDLVPFNNAITVNHIGPDSTGNIQIDTSGANGTPYVLPIATNAKLGGVIVTGTKGITINATTGEISSNIPSFQPRSIPFAANNGSLTEDNGGAFYNGVNATFGHQGNTYSGVGLNGNKAGVYASTLGMLLQLGDTSATDVDLNKSFKFYNGVKEYFRMYTTGTTATPDTYFNYAVFNSDVLPTLDLVYSLGSNSLRWLGIHGETIYATTVNADNINANSITTDSLFANSIVTNTLAATDIITDTFTANSANITNLSADTLNVNNLYATNANISTASITNLTADNATITTLNATYGNITHLTSDDITTGVLNATTINSTTINNSGDINTHNLNATNVSATSITTTNLTANSITTQKLYAGDINATNINTSYLSADTIDASTINTSNLNSVNVTATNITLGGDDLSTIIRNLSYSPYGDRNQIQYVSDNNSKSYYTEDVVAVGQFITTDAELATAKSSFVGFSTIFSTWKRFAHGPATLETSPSSPYGLPGIPLETNSWTYDSAANTVRSLSNSNNFIGFVSPQKYSRYDHSLTLTAQDGSESFNDNDFIIVIIAYSENPNVLVTNNAAGTNPATYNWAIDTTSTKIPDQNTLSLVRARTAQQPYNIDQSVRYAIVYNLGKPDQKVIANGESQVWNTELNYDTGKSCDVRVLRNGDSIKTYTTNWNDAPGGKGILGHELSIDLSSDPLLNKFRGFSSYGYGACSQKDSYFSNVSFSPSVNTIYDVRNGDVWVASAAGVYSKDVSRSFYTDFGIRRIYYNPTTTNLIYVKPDKNFHIINAASTAGGSGTISSIALAMGTTAVNNDLNVSPNTPVTAGAASFTINVPDATAGTRGVVTTGAQSWNGMKTFQTGITTLTNTSGANFFANGGSALYSSTLTQSELQFKGSTNVRARSIMRGTSNGTLGVGENYANLIVGVTPITTATSATLHTMLANVAIREVNAVIGTAGNLVNTANLYISSAGGAAVTGKNYSLYVDGETLLNGNVNMNDPLEVISAANTDLNGIYWSSQTASGVITGSASIKAFSDGAFSTTSIPSYIKFSTTAASSIVSTERMRITSAGKITNTLTNGAASAVVDFSNSNTGKGGILLPTVTAAQRTAIASPANGLLVYQSDGTIGFYYYNSVTAAWILLGSGGNGSITIDPVPTSGSANAVASGGTYDALATKVNLAGHNDLTGGNFGLGQAHDPTYRFYAQSGTSSLMKLNTSGTSGGNLRLESADIPTATTQRIFDVSFGMAGLSAIAYLRGAVDYTTASTTSTPSKLQFGTTPVGAIAPVKRLEIGNNGYLSTAAANPAAATAIDFSNSLGGYGGILLPQMTLAQRNALTSVPTSELIYQTDGTAGFYYYNGTAWVLLGSGGSASITIDDVPTSGSVNAVSSGGTYNALATKVNLVGNNSMTNGNLGLGQAYDPSYRLYVQSGSTTIVKFNTSNSLGGIFKLENSTLPTAAGTRIFANQFGVQGQSTSAYAGAYSDGAFTSGSSLPTYYSIATTAGGSTAVTEKFRVGSDGNLYIINTTTPPTANTDLHGLEWYVTGLYPSAAVKAYSDAAFSGTNISSSLSFQTANAGSAFLTERLKISSDGNTYISNDTVPTGANQYLHGLGWRAAQSSTAALIAAFSDGVHSSTSIPTVLSFGTTNAGSVFTSERFRIGSEGSLSNTGGNANPSAAVDFSNSNMFGHRGGLLIPQVTAAIRTAIASPAQGLMVYQTDGSAGFYYYQAGWIYMDPNANALGDASVSVRGAVNTTTQSFSGVKTFASGLVTGGHLGSTGSAPTVAAGAAISGGAGVTVTVVGTDTKGIITIHTGSTTNAANVVMVNITFAAAFTGSPVFILSPANSTAAIVNAWANCPTSGTAQIVTTDGSLPNNTDIVYHYMVMGS